MRVGRWGGGRGGYTTSPPCSAAYACAPARLPSPAPACLPAPRYYGGGNFTVNNPGSTPLTSDYVTTYLRGGTDGFMLKVRGGEGEGWW